MGYDKVSLVYPSPRQGIKFNFRLLEFIRFLANIFKCKQLSIDTQKLW